MRQFVTGNFVFNRGVWKIIMLMSLVIRATVYRIHVCLSIFSALCFLSGSLPFEDVPRKLGVVSPGPHGCSLISSDLGTNATCTHLDLSLSLDQNEITMIPEDLLQRQHHLTVLDISSNRLELIPRTLFNETPFLHSLYMDGNKISTIKPKTMFPRNSTLKVDASRNPFSCTCDLSWFVQWIRSSNVVIIHPEDTICSPSSIEKEIHSPILSFYPEQYCGINILAATCSPLAVVLLAVIGLMAYRYKWWLNYKIFLLKLVICGYEEINHDFDAQEYEYQLNIMYIEDDEGWVDEIMKPVLQERFPHLQKVVWGDNNLHIGMFYINALHYATDNSFKTVLLISYNSVDDAWFLTKLRIALEHLNDTRLDKVILMFLEDIQDDDLPYLVRLFLSKNKPYMLWTEDEDGQELFWAQFEKSMRTNKAFNNVIPI